MTGFTFPDCIISPRIAKSLFFSYAINIPNLWLKNRETTTL